MYFDRKALKRAAKALVNRGEPKGWFITLVYLLATTGVSAVAGIFTYDFMEPLYKVINEYNALIDSGELLTVSTVNAFSQQLISAMQGTGFKIALLVSLLISFYSMVVAFGYNGYALMRVRGSEGQVRDLFDWFHMAGKIIWLNVLEIIFIYLWSLLFFIPGLVAMYRYSMAVYCLLDDPDISALEAIRRSKALMRGKKGELFMLDLSFIGWLALTWVLVNVVGSACYAMPYGVYAIVVTLVECLVTMHLTAYRMFANAGFYLFTTRPQQAPPVQEYPNAENGGGGYEPPNWDEVWKEDGKGDDWSK